MIINSFNSTTNIIMFNLFKKYLSIEKLERKSFNQLFFWLIFASILVRWAPLRWFSKMLGEFRKEVIEEVEIEKLKIVEITKRNLNRWKRILPWKVKCFEESIAVKKLLEKYNISSTIYLGVDKNKRSNLIAHAWLKVNNDIVTGEKGYERFVIVGYYS